MIPERYAKPVASAGLDDRGDGQDYGDGGYDGGYDGGGFDGDQGGW